MDDNLAQDLVSMWQSELTAMAADRELREAWSVLVGLWAQSSSAALSAMAHERAARGARSVKPAGTAPAAAASESRLGEVEQLTRRVAELEQRLAQLLGDAGPGEPKGGV